MKELFLELPNEMYDKAKQEAKRKNMKVLDYIREQMMKKVGYEKAKNEPVIPNDINTFEWRDSASQ